MRIVLLSDIHANVVALRAVLDQSMRATWNESSARALDMTRRRS
jgi:hypothetical protein